jgi:hypothetical protein
MTVQRMPEWPPETAPLPDPEPAAMPEITQTACRQCGTQISGLDGRYSCGVCGWANDWSEGHRPLPTAADDPDAGPITNPLDSKGTSR